MAITHNPSLDIAAKASYIFIKDKTNHAYPVFYYGAYIDDAYQECHLFVTILPTISSTILGGQGFFTTKPSAFKNFSNIPNEATHYTLLTKDNAVNFTNQQLNLNLNDFISILQQELLA